MERPISGAFPPKGGQLPRQLAFLQCCGRPQNGRRSDVDPDEKQADGCCGRSCHTGAATLGFAEEDDSLLGHRQADRSASLTRCGLCALALVTALLGLGALAHQGKLSFLEPCQSAEPGDECYLAVMWARKTGIKEDPEWYPELTYRSSIDAFQAALWRKGQSRCQKPCEEPNADALDAAKDQPW